MRLFPIIAAVALSACVTEGSDTGHGANARSAEDEQNEFILKTPGSAVTVKVTADGASSPYTNIGHYGNVLRGTLNQSSSVEVEFSDTAVKGEVGPGLIDLHLTLVSPRIRMQGLYAGAQSDITIGPDAITGQIGLCYMELRKTGDHYVGQRTCNGNAKTAQLWLPKILTEFPISEFCAYMAILLSSTQ